MVRRNLDSSNGPGMIFNVFYLHGKIYINTGLQIDFTSALKKFKNDIKTYQVLQSLLIVISKVISKAEFAHTREINVGNISYVDQNQLGLHLCIIIQEYIRATIMTVILYF